MSEKDTESKQIIFSQLGEELFLASKKFFDQKLAMWQRTSRNARTRGIGATENAAIDRDVTEEEEERAAALFQPMYEKALDALIKHGDSTAMVGLYQMAERFIQYMNTDDDVLDADEKAKAEEAKAEEENRPWLFTFESLYDKPELVERWKTTLQQFGILPRT